MPDDKPKNNGVPLSRVEMLDKMIEDARESVFSGGVSDDIAEATGVAASKYKLVDRKLIVSNEICPVGHNHRNIALIEIFKNAAEAVEPALSLDAALDQFRAEAMADPPANLGFAEPTKGIGGVYPMEDGSVHKFLVLQQAFETETSLIGQPGQMSREMTDFMRSRFMQRRRLGGGGFPPANNAS